MSKKNSDSNLSTSSSSSNPQEPATSSAGGLNAPAIYGQLVTLDQLSHHQQQQQRKQQQQQQLVQRQLPQKTSAVTSATTSAKSRQSTTTPPPPPLTSSSSTNNNSSSNATYVSAYANLDPSYSLKNKPSSTKQQQPMDVVVESMDVVVAGSGESCPTAAATVVSSANSNTYSYPTFPLTSTIPVTSNETPRPVPGGGGGLRGALGVRTGASRLIVRMSVELIKTYENINDVSRYLKYRLQTSIDLFGRGGG